MLINRSLHVESLRLYSSRVYESVYFEIDFVFWEISIVLHTTLHSIEYTLVLWNGSPLGFSTAGVEAYKLLLWCRKALSGMSWRRANMLVAVPLVARETRHLSSYRGRCSTGISAGWDHNSWMVTQMTHTMARNASSNLQLASPYCGRLY